MVDALDVPAKKWPIFPAAPMQLGPFEPAVLRLAWFLPRAFLKLFLVFVAVVVL